jgi:hypothetical protein
MPAISGSGVSAIIHTVEFAASEFKKVALMTVEFMDASLPRMRV